MRIVVTGGRDMNDPALIHKTLDHFDAQGGPHRLAHGNQRGADTMAAAYAEKLGWVVVPYTAAWETYKHEAGPRRNQRMLSLECPDIVVVFPGGDGTSDCVNRAEDMALPLFYSWRELRL